MKVLVLCHGNINRSPLCAAVLMKHFPQLEVKQAALKEFKRPERAAAKMRRAAKEFGYDLEAHRSQPITKELLEWADKCIIMDNGNERRLVAFAQEQAVGFSYTRLSSYVLSGVMKSIPDPAFMKADSADFKTVVDIIIDASKRLGESLTK